MNKTATRIAIAGALGRMGRATAAAVAERADVSLGGRFGRPGPSPQDGLVSRSDALLDCDVVIDFTTGLASAALASQCAERGRPALVIGSTGFSAADEAAIQAASAHVAIVKAGNFSLGVNMLLGLVRPGGGGFAGFDIRH